MTLATIDAPLDLDEPDYRANRDIVQNAPAFTRMKADALGGRSFSNIVSEYVNEPDPAHPLKIIGGQHRIEAIREAHAKGRNALHGVKVYFGLTMEQRLDVQLISNTNIAVARDLLDRMLETVQGPQLRDWCQAVGLLSADQDFADRRERGGPVSVQLVRTFVINYYEGRKIDLKNFEATETQPEIAKTGQADHEWDKLRANTPDLWKDEKLHRAATEFARLMKAQRAAFPPKSRPVDYPEKAVNLAIVAAWAFVAGMMHNDDQKLTRHYALADQAAHDPLNAGVLTKGRHRSDSPQYRGLGYRTDPQECGRFVELFYVLADKGVGVTKASVDLAIERFFIKTHTLAAQKLEAKLN